jgi:formate dehydrogenase major subunit
VLRFPLTKHPQTSKQPFSLQTLAKTSRLRGATVTDSVCPYCAVGCGQLIFAKGGELIDIEGDPDSPISGGHLCPKGANAFQLAVNSHRVSCVVYRAPFSDRWETQTLDWAMDQIAQRVKAARDADLTTPDEQGRLLSF